MAELPFPPHDPAAPVQHGTPQTEGDGAGQDKVPAASGTESARVTAWVRGRVQGVGFRWWTRARALELGLAGWARNLDDGRVEVIAQGSRAACEALLAALRSGRTPGNVTGVTERWSEPRDAVTGFVER
jgi:acylphosphatase